MPKSGTELVLTFTHLNHKGFAVAYLDGQKFWALNALPGETAKVSVTKKKKGVFICRILDLLHVSEFRVKNIDPAFVCCSPWEILDFKKENEWKQGYIESLFSEFNFPTLEVFRSELTYNYRNKVEYSFYYDVDSEALSFGYFNRETTKGKTPHLGSSIAAKKINKLALKILEVLNAEKVIGRQLKTLILRYSFSEDTVVAGLFVKDMDFPVSIFGGVETFGLKGFSVFYSDPRSPASVNTQTLSQWGDMDLLESVLDLKFKYGFENFFQINPHVFESVLKGLRAYFSILDPLEVLDLYAGVGTLGFGLSRFATAVTGVEISTQSKDFASENASLNNLSNIDFKEMPAEECLDEIRSDQLLIVDPPRSGLHPKLIDKILEVKPRHLVYLSCNPATQAENWSLLGESYVIKFMRGYNFYPHTPHVENLIIAEPR